MQRTPVQHRWRAFALGAVTLLPVLSAAVLVCLPGAFDQKLAVLLRGVCAQRPDHALGFAGGPVVLEARMFGIFAGFALTVLAAWFEGRERRVELPRGPIGLVALAGIAATAVDGLNAALFDLHGPALYPPSNALRLATGLACGVGLAAFIAPVVSFAFWRRCDPRPLFVTWGELGRAAGWTAVFGLLAASELVPAAALGAVAVLAVVGSFWLVSTYVAVLFWEGPGRAERWTDLTGHLAAGYGLVAVELWGMAWLRTWIETTLGIPWVV